jgi:hypothetical protein
VCVALPVHPMPLYAVVVSIHPSLLVVALHCRRKKNVIMIIINRGILSRDVECDSSRIVGARGSKEGGGAIWDSAHSAQIIPAIVANSVVRVLEACNRRPASLFQREGPFDNVDGTYPIIPGLLGDC